MCHKDLRTLSSRLTPGYDKVQLYCPPYRTFDTLRSVNRAEVVENKRLGPALELIAAMQAEREVSRSQKAPHRTG